MKIRPPLVAWIFLAAILLYALTCTRFYVGRFGDDARDILAAQSLAMGAYRNLQLPGLPPLNFPLPGFPLLLAPFTLLVRGHWEMLRIVPIFLTFLCVGLTTALFGPALSSGRRLLLAALFAFNPLTVGLSGYVIADSAYLAGLLAALLLLRRQETTPARWSLPTLGLVTAWTSIVRPEGAMFVAAAAFVLLWARRFRVAAWMVLPAIGVWLGLFLRNRWVTGSVSGYGNIWLDAFSFLSGGYDALAQHVGALIRSLILEAGLGLPGPTGGTFFVVLLAILVSAAIVAGGRITLAQPRMSPLVLGIAVVYVVLHLLLHVAWSAADAHYLWPLLPFLFFAAIQVKLPRAIAGAVVAALLLLYGWSDVQAIREARQPLAENRRPDRTLEWIRTNTPPTAFVLAPEAPVITLYTGRFATALVGARDADEFRYRLLKQGVTHVQVSAVRFMYVKGGRGRSPEAAWAQIRKTLARESSAYRSVFVDTEEAREVFEVLPSPEFVAAYGLYMKALNRAEAEAAVARSDLERAIALDPFPGALFASAILMERSGSQLSLAKARMEKALEVRPDDVFGWLSLARLHRRLGEKTAALAAYDRADASLPAAGRPNPVSETIARERAAL